MPDDLHLASISFIPIREDFASAQDVTIEPMELTLDAPESEQLKIHPDFTPICSYMQLVAAPEDEELKRTSRTKYPIIVKAYRRVPCKQFLLEKENYTTKTIFARWMERKERHVRL